VLTLRRKGRLEVGAHGDILALDRDEFRLVHLLAQGRRMVNDGRLVTHESFLEGSNRGDRADRRGVRRASESGPFGRRRWPKVHLEFATQKLSCVAVRSVADRRVLCGETTSGTIPASLRAERSVNVQKRTPDFSDLFDRAAAACAESQRIVGLSARTVRLAHSGRAESVRIRRVAMLMRDTWAEAEAVHWVLRNEVERVARMMREAGVDDHAAVATVRAHIRFVLYDGGLAERDAEPVVDRASLWVEQIYAAA
jgi:hypothetical protein